MIEQDENKLGFREWTAHYEKEQEADRDKINALADGLAAVNANLGRLTANVETLLENQKGMFTKINRPTEWGTLIAAGALVAITLGLVTGPMKEDIAEVAGKLALETERDIELHIMFNNRLAEQIQLATENHTNIEWVMKLEDRLNDRLHSGLDRP